MGTLSISTAALIMVVTASDATCIVVEWIINLGYTLELVPLLVKVAANICLAMAAQTMKRVTHSAVVVGHSGDHQCYSRELHGRLDGTEPA